MPLALFTDSTPLTPIRNLFNAIIQQVNKQEIINYADLDALPSTAGLTEGTRAHVDELNVDFQVQDGDWVQVGSSRFASTSARDTAYAKASGTYLVAGVTSTVTATTPFIDYRYTGSAWVATNEDTGWVTPSFSNGWSAASGYPVGYRRRNGIVYLRGRVTGGSTGVGFVLPAGFIPGQQSLFSGVDGGSATARAWIFINAAGNVQFQSGQVAQLDEIRFIAEA